MSQKQESSLHNLLDEAWRQVSDGLRESMPESQWRDLIAPLVPKGIQKGEILLEAPTARQADRVELALGSRLELLFGKALGVPLRVRLLAGEPPPVPLERTHLVEALYHEGNRMAVQALQELREPQGDQRFNPLFLWGKEGVGKSFLLKAILLGPRTEGGLYCTATTFLEDLAHARRRVGGLSRFRERLLGTRLLILDEAHRLRDKPATQAEVVHLAKVLLARRARVVFCARYPAREIRQIDRSFLSMLLAGMTVEIKVPAEATRLQALVALEQAAGPPHLPALLLQSLAARHRTGFGPLQEAWLRFRQSGVRPGTPEEAAELVDQITAGHDTLDRLLRRVASHFGLAPEELAAEKRSRHVSYARQVAAYTALERGFSLAAVGQRLGGRSRSTISYMKTQIEKARRLDPALDRLLEDLL